MDTMQQFKKLVDSLKDINPSVATKLQKYSNLRDILPDKLTKGDVVKNEDTLRCLFDRIKSDVVSESLDLRQLVLTILDQLCKCTWRNFIIQELTDVCIHMSFDDVTENKDDVRAVAGTCLQYVLQQQILQNDCDPEKLLLKVNNNVARKKILQLLEKACSDIPSQQSLLFFYEIIVPAMFNTSHVDVRGCLVEFLFSSLPKFGIGSLSMDKLEKFKLTTKKTYVEKTVKLLESGDPHWNNVWIFLVRCHGKRLHTHSDIMNALLKVVEVAFRSKVIDNNSAAYDCWKELIDVYSLDLEQMCSAKYMKLLLLPLRNNALKNGNLTKKRFEVWTHLISILQEKSYDLCMRQFLDFCFGPLGENPLITRGNPNIGSPARTNAELWQGSAQALQEIIGHYGHDSSSCMQCTNYPLLKLEKPLLTTNNFAIVDYIIINSVGECCSLMLNRMNKESTRNLFSKTITCLWDSLFSIIEQLEKPHQESAIRRVTALLAVYVELSNETSDYFEYILKPIFELLANKKLFRIDVPTFNTQLFFPLLKKFLKHSDVVFLSGQSAVLELLKCSKNTHNKNSWLEEAFEIFVKTDAKKSNINGLLFFWDHCADVLNDVCESPTAQTEKVVQGVGIGFMVWPVLNFYRLSLEQLTRITEVSQKWSNTFASMLKTYTKESLIILMDIQKSIGISPFIASHVAQLYPGFQPLLDTEPNHKFVMILLNLTSVLLGIPTVTKEVKSLILPTVILIMNYFTEETEKTSKYSDFQHLCQCFEHLLILHKEYSILEPMESFFDKIPKSYQENVSQSLCAVFDALKIHIDDTISQKAQKLSSKCISRPVESSSKAEETFLQPKFMQSSRAAKITNMAIATPKSPKLDIPEGTTVLRLLGHKVETPLPVRVRGSQINSSSKPQKRKAANVFPEMKKSKVRVDDEEASYILIDQLYKFDPTKLSEHQVEVMKKRRSDIPALYQDLSQSQSNSESFLNIKKVEVYNEDKPGSLSSNNCNETSAKNTVEPVPKPDQIVKKATSSTVDEKTMSEDLFQTQDVTTTLPTPNLSEKKENYIDNRDKKHDENKSVSVQKSANSKAHFKKFEQCKVDEKKVNKKSLNIIPPKDKKFIPCGSEESKDKTKQNQQTRGRGRPRILKPRKLYNDSVNSIKASDKSDIGLSSNELHLKEKIDDSVFKNKASAIHSGESVDDNLGDSRSVGIDLKIQNPSMKKIEAMITGDSPSSNYDHGLLSVLLKQNSSSNDAFQHENLASNSENKQLPVSVNEENKNQDSLSDKEKKKQKIMKELNKIKMDIVGGDVYVRNLDFTKRVRTRRSVDATTLTLRSGSKISNYDSDDSKSSSSSESSRKPKLRATVKIVDKLTLSPKSSSKLRQSAITSSPKNNSKSHSDTSNNAKFSPGRRKILLEDTTLESAKNNAASKKQIALRRRSTTPDEPSQSGAENTNPSRRKSKSVSPEKPSQVIEESVSPSRRKSRSDKNWIAKVNKSLEECAKYSRVGARKSLANALESASKADSSDKQDNINPFTISTSTKTNQKSKIIEGESGVAKNLEFTVTLVSNTESQNSEDVIESSQESCVEIKPCQNSDNSLEGIRKGINLQIEEVVTQLRKREVQNSDSVGLVIENRTDNLELVANTSNFETNIAECSSQDVKNKILKDNLSNFSPDELMRMDLTSHIKPNTNDTCEMDTETLDILTDTPTKLLGIPTSPIGSDTPTRTSELISNTLNISPIKLIPKSIIRENNSEKTPDLFDSEPCTSNKLPTPKIESENSVQNQQHATPTCSAIPDKTNQRSLKLLSMLSCTPSPENRKIQNVKQTSKPVVSSPKTHRIMKMMQTIENKSEPEDVEEVVELDDNDEEPERQILEKDILTFVKELPSPMASPRYSILKRRAPDSRDEGLSPPRKKRVNFSDPPTTCEKIFFKDKNEHFHTKKGQYNEDTGYDNTMNTQEMENISTASTNTEPPILEPMEYIEPPILEAVKNAPTSISNNAPTSVSNNAPNGQPLNLEETCSEKETESLSTETQGSVDMTIPYLLECTQPILPEFVHCTESIDCVIVKMTNPLFCLALEEALHKKNVFTIGDLAKLSEIEVTRLPFRTPKVLVVRTTLRKFMSQKSTEGANIELKTNEDVEDNSRINDDESNIKTEETYRGINNEEAQKRNDILTQEKQKHLADNSQDSKLLNATSDSPKVKIVSSIILQPAHSVPQNSTIIDKSPRRVPLIKVTSSNTPTCSTFMQVEPLVTAAKIEQSSSKESDSSKTVIFGNVEEREKLRIRIPELIADFQEMREKVKRQGLSTTSLYEFIIDIVGTEEFVSILQENRALSINHFVKNDNWCALINETLNSIGLNNIVSCLCNVRKVTPLKLVDSIVDHITTEEEGKNCSSSLEKIARRVLKTVPLSNILQKLGMRRVVDALSDMNKNSEFTVKDFLQHATFKFSPSLDDMVSSFRNINIVQVGGEAVQLSRSNKKDFEVFLKKIGPVVAAPTVSEICKNETFEMNAIAKCVPEEKKEELMYMFFDELPLPKQEKVVITVVGKMSSEKQKELAFSVFDKMSEVDAYHCWFNYFHKRLRKT